MEHLASGGDILQLVTFKMNTEEYAVDILKVQEINRMSEIAKVPNAPPYVEGVINLRGRVIPVVSLSKRFGFAEKEMDSQSRIIIMDIQGITIGVIVDSVSEVLRIPSNTVEPAPNFSNELGSEFMKGIAKMEDRLIILIDMDILIEHAANISMLDTTQKTIDG